MLLNSLILCLLSPWVAGLIVGCPNIFDIASGLRLPIEWDSTSRDNFPSIFTFAIVDDPSLSTQPHASQVVQSNDDQESGTASLPVFELTPGNYSVVVYAGSSVKAEEMLDSFPVQLVLSNTELQPTTKTAFIMFTASSSQSTAPSAFASSSVLSSSISSTYTLSSVSTSTFPASQTSAVEADNPRAISQVTLAGIITGAVILICIIGIFLILWRRRSSRPDDESSIDHMLSTTGTVTPLIIQQNAESNWGLMENQPGSKQPQKNNVYNSLDDRLEANTSNVAEQRAIDSGVRLRADSGDQLRDSMNNGALLPPAYTVS